MSIMFWRLLSRKANQLIGGGKSILLTEPASICPILKNSGAQFTVPSVNLIRGIHQSLGPKVQQPAPPFKGTAVFNGDFKDITLADFKGHYLVLFFYPLDFTFVCPTEIIAFSDRIDEFKAINTAVVGVSCDSHFSHLAWINTPRKHGGLGKLCYPLLADFNKTIARDYNVLLDDEGVPLRGLFIIDPQSVVRQITVNDLPVGRSVDEVLRLVKAFQYTDKHGEELHVKSKDSEEVNDFREKFSVANIKLLTQSSGKTELSSGYDTEDTKGLTMAELERAVLLDQLKYYRIQLNEYENKKLEAKKHEATTLNLLEERDCISV